MEATTGIVVLVVLSAFFAVMYGLGLNERAKRVVTCPRARSNADVRVLQRYGRPDKAVRVESCSLLPDPNRVDCAQECVKTAR